MGELLSVRCDGRHCGLRDIAQYCLATQRWRRPCPDTPYRSPQAWFASGLSSLASWSSCKNSPARTEATNTNPLSPARPVAPAQGSRRALRVPIRSTTSTRGAVTHGGRRAVPSTAPPRSPSSSRPLHLKWGPTAGNRSQHDHYKPGPPKKAPGRPLDHPSPWKMEDTITTTINDFTETAQHAWRRSSGHAEHHPPRP